MFRKISTVLLSLVLVWYAAVQAEEEKPHKKQTEGISVYAPLNLNEERINTEGEEIYGQVRLTAALSALGEDTKVRVDFILEGKDEIYRKSVEITPENTDEREFFSATAVFSDLKSGLYTAYIEQAEGAVLDYILLEKGDGPEYKLNRTEITFELRHSARLGTARFIMKEIP